MEKESKYWKDKCETAEAKSDQINYKIVELENELRAILFEKTLSNSQKGVQTHQQERLPSSASEKKVVTHHSEPQIQSNQRITTLYVPPSQSSSTRKQLDNDEI